MYEYLKMLQSAAEQIGSIHDVRVSTEDKYWGNQVKISGTTIGGQAFELELTVREATNAEADRD